jgi:hypothetical protein
MMTPSVENGDENPFASAEAPVVVKNLIPIIKPKGATAHARDKKDKTGGINRRLNITQSAVPGTIRIRYWG